MTENFREVVTGDFTVNGQDRTWFGFCRANLHGKIDEMLSDPELALHYGKLSNLLRGISPDIYKNGRIHMAAGFYTACDNQVEMEVVCGNCSLLKMVHFWNNGNWDPENIEQIAGLLNGENS